MYGSEKALRAARFASNVKNLSHFITSDNTTKELYGYTQHVLNENNLRRYYERHETIKEWRDWDTFKLIIEGRVDCPLNR